MWQPAGVCQGRHQIPLEGKVGVPLGWRAPEIKPHPEEKWAWPSAPIYLWYPL